MITVNEAKKSVLDNTTILSPISLQLAESANLILAEDVYSKIDFPPFNQSGMDGYAFKFRDWEGTNPLTIKGEIPAGDYPKKKLKAGEAIRIFTGAPLPKEADTVVMQEKVSVENDRLIIRDSDIVEGAFVRKQGAQTSAGDIALKAFSKLSPAAVAFLASIGCDRVEVFPHPIVRIITTGNELQVPGMPLEEGEVYECNSFGLLAALNELGIHGKKHFTVRDHEKRITNTLKNHLDEADIVIFTGGVSVGDYDLVVKTLDTYGVRQIFHNVKQRPGKPLYFGMYKNTLVFGLPGNPASVLCCYYEYILPAIKKMMGSDDDFPITCKMPLATTISKKVGLTYFVIGKISGKEVEPLPYRESYQLSSFALADCIIKLDENVTECHQGEVVTVHLLKQQ